MIVLIFCVFEVILLLSANGVHPCDDCGNALFLTPYIKENLTSEARTMSKVESFLPKQWQLTSHSGYLTVNEKYDSNLFFWLFPSMKDPQNAPLVLWLEGTPGTASSSSAFFRNGPYIVSKCQCECQPISLSPAFYQWSEIMHVLYIDSPVGTGFSFTKNASGLAKSADDIVDDLYSAVTQIFQLFPEYQNSEFYIVGESYAAKHVALLAYMISLKTPSAAVGINLKGIAIGNGWLEPANMLGYSEVLFDVGLIDSNTRDDFLEIENTINSLIRNESYSEAYDLLQTYFPVENSESPVESSIVENSTGFKYFGNFLRHENNDENDYAVKVMKFLNQPEIRWKLHVGSQTFTSFNDDVFEKLKIDLLKPVGPEMGAVLDSYRVLIYNGQLDITCAYHLTMKILHRIRWAGLGSYKKAKRRKWCVEGQLAGYVKTAGNFSEILVRDAGHRLAEDRPLWVWDLMKKFTHNIPFA